MTQYRVLTPLTMAEGGNIWPGSVVELDDHTGAILAKKGVVELAAPPAPPAPVEKKSVQPKRKKIRAVKSPKSKE